MTHQKRQFTTIKLPIPRKGTKYVVRASSDPKNSVPVLIAVRDMLHLAKTAREVKEMIKSKALKLNGRDVTELKASIKLFNIFQADKTYRLTILPTNKFHLEEIKPTDSRLLKVTNKKILPKNQLQINFHDGTNIITKDKMNVNDSVLLSFDSKIKSHIKPEKGAGVFVFKGKYLGRSGNLQSLKGSKISVKFRNTEGVAEIPFSHAIVQ